MSQGNDFANYGSAAADKPAEDGLWYVAIASDDIKTMTLDQLDDAFRLGVISAETSVWTEGMEAWAPLREVAGLEDGDDSSSDSLENEETVARGQRAPAHVTAAAQATSFAPPANQGFQSPFGAVVESSSQGAGSLSPFGLSTAPVALNVDEDMPPMRSARGLGPKHWAIGGVAVLGLGIALYSGLFSSSAAGEQPVTAAASTPQVTGLALNAKQADPAADEADEDPATKAVAADEKKEVAEAADEPAEEKAEATKPELDAKKVAGAAAVAAPAAAALKGSVSDALRSNKKGATTRQASMLKRKPAKKARATTKAKRASASKSIGGPSKGGSAFDPLNDSLP
jgi:hypothetical protein